MAESVKGATALQQELEKTRESLKGVDDNIRKLTGRDPAISRPFVGRRIVYDDARGPGGSGGGGGNGETQAGRNSFGSFRRSGAWSGNVRHGDDETAEGLAPAAKRRTVGESRLAGRLGLPQPSADRHHSEEEDEDLPHKPAIASSVVTAVHPPPDPKARQVLIEQNADTKSRERNKRMFGALLGTLQRFKDESKQADEREKRRQQVERKLEEKQRNERENLRRERQALFGERRRKETQMRQIQQKIYLVQQFELWEKETRKLANFIRTKAKPFVYFMPKALVPGNESQIEATKKAVDDIVIEKRRRLEADIERLMGGSGGVGAGGDDEGVDEDDDHTAAAAANNSLPGRLAGRDVASEEDDGEDGEIRERGAGQREQGSDPDDEMPLMMSNRVALVSTRPQPALDVAAAVMHNSEPAAVTDELVEGEHMDLAYAAAVVTRGDGESGGSSAPLARAALSPTELGGGPSEPRLQGDLHDGSGMGQQEADGNGKLLLDGASTEKNEKERMDECEVAVHE